MRAPLLAQHPIALPDLTKKNMSKAIEQIKGRRQREKRGGHEGKDGVLVAAAAGGARHRDRVHGGVAGAGEQVPRTFARRPQVGVCLQPPDRPKDDNDDVSVYPNSLNRYLLRMRKAGKLDGLPDYWPHLTRSAAGNYLDNWPDVPPVASSLMLGHALPGTVEDAAPTTKRFYLTSQRMVEKAVAMKAWSNALVEAFLKAGGTLPGK